MRYLKISNPGEITKEAIELFGYSDKRNNSDLIGEKGTGLKFARFQALRQGVEFFVCTSAFQNYLVAEDISNGNKRLSFCYKTRNNRVQKVQSSYTIDGGVFDWDDEWFIVREVVQNARDEFVKKEIETPAKAMELTLKSISVVNEISYAKTGATDIYIGITPNIEEKIKNIQNYFCYDFIEENKIGGALEKKGKGLRIYKQGIFCGETNEANIPWDFMIHDITLSESRTIKSWGDVSNYIIKFVDNASIDFKEKYLLYCKGNENLWEFNVGWHTFCASDWKIAFYRIFGDNVRISPRSTASKYEVERLKEKGLEPVVFPQKIYDILKSNGVKTVMDERFRDPYQSYNLVSLTMAENDLLKSCIKKVGKIFKEIPPIDVFIPETTEQHNTNGEYLAVTNKIFLNNGLFSSERNLLKTLIEECLHAESKATDFSREFQNASMEKLTDLLLT